MSYDVIIRNGLWFDGTGTTPQIRTLGIRDGILVAVSPGPLDEAGCPDVIDAAGKWIVPGFIDVHTHYDAEVLLDPGLRESVRHGVTTVLLGNCSLSTVYANSEDAADLFSRVEAVPRKFVLGALKDKKTWATPPSTSGPWTTCRSVPMSVPCSDIRICAPPCSASTAPPPMASGRQMPSWTGWHAARRGARRRAARHVRDGRAHRQARRGALPVTRAAVDLRDVAGTPQADRSAAQAPSHSAECTQHEEPARGADVLPDQQPDVRPPAGCANEPAGFGRRQVRTRCGARVRSRHKASE